MLGRLGLGILISCAIHFWAFGRAELIYFPSITLASYPVSMELSLTASKPAFKELQFKEVVPLEAVKKVVPKIQKVSDTPTRSVQKEKESYSVKTPTLPAPAEQGIQKATSLPGQKPPVYPTVARYRHIEGTVLLVVEVLANGQCGKIKIKESSGAALLDKAAVEGIKKWRFEPALKNGQKVASFIEVPVVFELKSD